MAAPFLVAKAYSRLQRQFTSGANAFGQKAAADVLLSVMPPTNEMNASSRKRRDLVINLLKENTTWYHEQISMGNFCNIIQPY